MADKVSPDAILARLADLWSEGETCGIALDADGTLWTGDVGEDTFEYAIEQDLLKGEAGPRLSEFAAAHGARVGDTPSATARAILEAFRHGHVMDLPACEVMTWAYAGFRTEDLLELVKRALAAAALERRKQRLLVPIVDWARQHDVRLLLISASPQIVVEEAARNTWGLSPAEIIGARPKLRNGTIEAAMAEPVPFANRKTELARAYFAGARWLASFGDNFFDLDLLRAAEVGVAVNPKPALLSRIEPRDAVWILQSPADTATPPAPEPPIR